MVRSPRTTIRFEGLWLQTTSISGTAFLSEMRRWVTRPLAIPQRSLDPTLNPNFPAHPGQIMYISKSVGPVSGFKNALLGIFVGSNSIINSTHVFLQMWSRQELLNPVLGLRLVAPNPTLTIGAFDESAFSGQLNWVPDSGNAPVSLGGVLLKNRNLWFQQLVEHVCRDRRYYGN